MVAQDLGRSVLYLVTDDSGLKRGIAQAKQDTDQYGKQARENARVVLSADAATLRADLNRAQQLIAQGKAGAAKDLLYQVRTDTALLRSGLSDALRQSRAAKDSAETALLLKVRASLPQFTADLRTMEREATSTARAIAQQEQAFARQTAAEKRALAKQVTAEARTAAPQAADPGGGGGGSGFLGAVGAGVGFTTGAAAVTAGVAGTVAVLKGGVGTVLEYNAAIQQSRAQILGFTNDQRVVAQVTELSNKAVADGRGTYRETYQALADLTPLARTYRADLGDLLKTAQLLAAIDPAQGFEGASVALREALSGDFTSLTRRFEIPRAEIQKLKDEGVPNLQIVQKALAGLGITDRVLTTRAGTFNQQISIAADEFRRFIAEAGQPIFDAAAKGLSELRASAGSPEFKALGDTLRDAATGAARLTTELLHAGEAALTLLGRIAKINQDLNDPNGPVERFINRVLPGGGPGTGAVAIPTPGVTPGLPAITPIPSQPDYDPGEAVRAVNTTQSKARAERAAFLAGQAELRAYISGFTSGNFAVLNAVQPQLQAAFDRLFGGLTDDEKAAKGAGQISVLAARIADDIKRYGAVSVETGNQVRAILGDQAGDVLKLADAYAKLADDQNRLTAATNAAAVAAGNLAVVRGAAAQAEAAAQEKIAALQARASANATAAQNEARVLQEGMEAVGREADRVSRGYDEQLRGLQNTLSAISRAADEAQRGFAEQSRIAQSEQQAAQEAATRNAAAYAAVLNGTTEEYRRQNEQLSEQERRILALGDAALTAALKAKTAQDDKVQGLEVQQRAQLLALEERIRAARSRGGPQGELEARRLEAERDRLKAQSEYQLQLERQRAAVRGDEANTARKPVEEAAAAQATEDKKRVDAAGERVSEIQEQARLRAEADRAAQQAIQDQITGVQEQARQAAEMYAERQRGIQEEIRLVGVRARDQATADQAAIDGATVALGLVKKIEQSRIDGAKLGADNAQRAANMAQSEFNYQTLTLGILGQQNTLLNERLKAFQDFIDKNPGILSNAALNVAGQPSAVGGARDNTESGLNPDGTPKGSPAPAPAGGYTGKGSNLRAGDFARSAYTPLPRVPTPQIAPIRFTIPAPPSLGVAAFAGGGAPAFARAGGAPIVNINAPLTSFPNATIRETVEVERAIRGGADLALRLLHDAQSDDDAGGGTLVRGH